MKRRPADRRRWGTRWVGIGIGLPVSFPVIGLGIYARHAVARKQSSETDRLCRLEPVAWQVSVNTCQQAMQVRKILPEEYEQARLLLAENDWGPRVQGR